MEDSEENVGGSCVYCPLVCICLPGACCFPLMSVRTVDEVTMNAIPFLEK